jgi:transcriptional regulator with XRE-family HTH domain
MSNERLRSSITAAGLSLESFAAHIGVDPKTVERWISKERTPHRAHRWKAAQALGRDEAYLWPEVLDQPRTQAASEAEFVHLYPHRGAVPKDLWRELVADARDSLDVLAYAALFLPDSDPDFADKLVAKAADGVRVRVLLGDREADAVLRRGLEEAVWRPPGGLVPGGRE